MQYLGRCIGKLDEKARQDVVFNPKSVCYDKTDDEFYLGQGKNKQVLSETLYPYVYDFAGSRKLMTKFVERQQKYYDKCVLVARCFRGGYPQGSIYTDGKYFFGVGDRVMDESGMMNLIDYWKLNSDVKMYDYKPEYEQEEN